MLRYRLFVSLSPPEIELRRDRLNQAGFYGWLSPIVLLLAIYTYRKLIKVFSGPQHGKSKSHQPNALAIQYRRLNWVLSTSLPTDFGDLLTHLLGLIYASWLLVLAFRHTGVDYMHLTKSLAHVAISQLPLHYLLAIKSPNSPIQTLTGLSHERLNAYHRLLGRIIHILLGTHAVLYLNFFVQAGVLEKRIQHMDVRLGIAAFWTLNILAVLALPLVRRRAYHRIFYRSHVLLPFVLLGLVWFHVPYTRIYVAQAAVFWVVNGVTRSLSSTKSSTARIEKIEGTELLKLSVPVNGTSALNDFVPGEHVYVKPTSGVLGPKTPFTIVDVKSNAGRDEIGNPVSNLTLVIRNLGGPQTGKLAEAGSAEVSMEGPYGEAREYIPDILDSDDNILLVAGGVGATYTLPIYISLLRNRKSVSGLRFVWVVRSSRDAAWGIELLHALSVSVGLDVEIYLTHHEEGQHLSGIKPKSGIKVIADGRRPNMSTLLELSFSTHSTSRPTATRLLSSGTSTKRPRSPMPTWKSKREYTPVTVLACGPPGLVKALRREVGRDVLQYGRDVRMHEEQFGLGSS